MLMLQIQLRGGGGGISNSCCGEFLMIHLKIVINKSRNFYFIQSSTMVEEAESRFVANGGDLKKLGKKK